MVTQVYEIRRAVSRLECSSCGAEANASCDCGKPYVPAKVRAAEAIKANPEKSDRAIAADLGVSHTTVQNARKETGNQLPVDERVGLDGKTRRLPQRPTINDDGDPADSDRTALLLRASTAHDLAGREYVGQVDAEIIEVVNLTAVAWSRLAAQLKEKANVKATP